MRQLLRVKDVERRSHCKHTFADRIDARGKAQASESIIEYLIKLQGGSSIVRYFNAGSQAVKYSIPPENRVGLCRD